MAVLKPAEKSWRQNTLVLYPEHARAAEIVYLTSTGLGRWTVAKVFWKAMLFCMILNWAALNDGVSQLSRNSFIVHVAYSLQSFNSRFPAT